MFKYSAYLGNRRDKYISLLLMGDEDERKLSEYLNQGTLFLAEKEGDTIAVAIIVPTNDCNVIELKNIAVDAKFRGQGIGSKMIAYILEQVSGQYNMILVGTGDADVQNILFYLKNGFRFYGIKKNFFNEYREKIISNGVVLQDMVLLTKKLTNN